MDIGDLLVMLGRYVAEPVRISVHNGIITKIDGGVDAVLFEEHIGAGERPGSFHYFPYRLGNR